jgi:cytochrome P450
MQETLRWRPINKLGSNHYLIEDTWYKDYFLPKNSILMINQWAIHYVEDDFPDPWKVYIHGGEANASTIPRDTSMTS